MTRDREQEDREFMQRFTQWAGRPLDDAPGTEPAAEPTGPVEPLGPVLPVLADLTPDQRRIAVALGRRMAGPGRGPVLFVGGRVPGKRSLMAAAQAVAEQVLAGVPAMVVIDDPPEMDPRRLAAAVLAEGGYEIGPFPSPTLDAPSASPRDLSGKGSAPSGYSRPLNRHERRREAALRRRGLR